MFGVNLLGPFLDVMVVDVVDTFDRVGALGASAGRGLYVFADPVGHPICLIVGPGWAAPVQ